VFLINYYRTEIMFKASSSNMP